MNRVWLTVQLCEVLRHRKEFIVIDDTAVYKRPRVQLHAQGIVFRDELPGALIKTKTQQVCRAGELLVAEIDAKVGGFGIVPEILDGSIVSSHYFLFVIDKSRLDRRFLDYFIRTPTFRDQVEAQGSTNYAAIRPAHVLDYEIPLPPLAEQRRIVARIDQLAESVDEIRKLRNQSAEAAESLVVSLHVTLAGRRLRKLGEVLHLHQDAVGVSADRSYPQVGVKSFGGGLFRKGSVAGTSTTYRTFNTLFSGALVLSQVKAWEGAVAVCPNELSGWFVSPEYRTFRCVPGEARPGYLASIVRTQWFWSKLAKATRGVGARRERTRPEQVLEIEILMPNEEQQSYGEQVFAELAQLEQVQRQTTAELDALLPAILDRAFRGEL